MGSAAQSMSAVCICVQIKVTCAQIYAHRCLTLVEHNYFYLAQHTSSSGNFPKTHTHTYSHGEKVCQQTAKC